MKPSSSCSIWISYLRWTSDWYDLYLLCWSWRLSRTRIMRSPTAFEEAAANKLESFLYVFRKQSYFCQRRYRQGIWGNFWRIQKYPEINQFWLNDSLLHGYHRRWALRNLPARLVTAKCIVCICRKFTYDRMGVWRAGSHTDCIEWNPNFLTKFQSWPFYILTRCKDLEGC